ncbi:MAG: T9SS type A sorting domain-containing protein, partial [Flavobacteriaceae bacterium]|nr:T9SS type A sorting domain-containing protein [Flavobacteriaceae bacterium]
IDGFDYVGNSQFGSGENLGDNTFVVYNGIGSNVTVTNLDASKRYAIRVYEYTKNANNGNNALYLLGSAAEREAALGIDDKNLSEKIKIYPTISSDILNVHVKFTDEVAYNLYDVQGRTLWSNRVDNGDNKIDVSRLSSGLYLITFIADGKKMTARFIKK